VVSASATPSSPVGDDTQITLTAEASDDSGIDEMGIWFADDRVETCESAPCSTTVSPSNRANTGIEPRLLIAKVTREQRQVPSEVESTDEEDREEDDGFAEEEEEEEVPEISPSPPLDPGQSVNLRAEVHSKEEIQRIQLWLDGDVVGTCEDVEVCETTVESLGEGRHNVYADALDGIGKHGASLEKRFDMGVGDDSPDRADITRIDIGPLIRQPPKKSALTPQTQPHQPDIKYGGRALAAAVHPNFPSGQEALVASESGGLWETTDGGSSWRHVDGRYPHSLHDVAYAPSDPGTILVTGPGDSRRLNGTIGEVSAGGIYRSTDGGQTWTKPATAEPNQNCPRKQPKGHASAQGIAFEPGTRNVYVGTDCGLAISTNLGQSWRHVATPGRTTFKLVSVISTSTGVVDVCTNRGSVASGHLRYDTSADRWVPATTGTSLPGGCHGNAIHSLAVSLTDANVLFAIVPDSDSKCNDNTKREVYESDDGGQTWTDPDAPGCTGNRIPFIATPPSTDGNGN